MNIDITAVLSKQMRSALVFRRVVSMLMMVATAFFFWNIGKVITNTESPIVVVLSGSMEPAFFRGDILLAYHRHDEYEIGDIAIYTSTHKSIPIVHRIVEVRKLSSGKIKLLTKGDNNFVNDRNLYGGNVRWLESSDLQGRIIAKVPLVGMPTILINEHNYLKYLLILLIVITSLLSREDS